LATQFSNAVQSALGTSFNTTTNGTGDQNVASYPGGPWFFIEANGTGNGINNWQSPTFCYWNGSSTICPLQTFTGPGFGSITGSNVFARNGNTSLPFAFTFAQADLVPPVTGPLPALGAAAAFGFSRKLRQRIKVSKAVGGSITFD
jgi:hypothetical protein